MAYENKVYRFKPSFKPLFKHAVDQVLAGLTSGYGVSELMGEVETLLHAMLTRLNQPDLDTLATVTRAIHRRAELRLTYHSMKTGAVRREIVPHALVDSGLRWHVRAYDRTKEEFRDLVITRMEGGTLLEIRVNSRVVDHEFAEADEQWNRMLELSLVPHPRHPHPSSIVRDFGMELEGHLRITLRAAVAGYVLRQWQVDCSEDAKMMDPEFRLWLSNSEQLNTVNSAPLAPWYGEKSTIK
ncbi:MAG: WYL domain-containing protein [Candidatus Protistobacter heckmanni]|nr:WYL domain-containing protein [Candidatus Protistobacter heckmanni]